MKTATVRDLRYRFPEVENLKRDGEEVQRPDFLARLKKIVA